MKSIIVFGSGKYAEEKWELIQKTYNIVAVVDNKVKKDEITTFHGIEMHNPCHIKRLGYFPVLVVVHAYRDVVQQLVELGIDQENIWIYRENLENNQSNYISSADINKIVNLPEVPLHYDWGYRRGTPIGRLYIERFLRQYRNFITGDIMEVGETTYSKKYSNLDKAKSYTAIHVDGIEGCRTANLETGEGLRDEEFDTMIITQTLAYIYDLRAVINNIYRSLRRNGYCLVTVTDIGHMGKLESEKYGVYWGFHRDGIFRLFSEVFGEANVKVEVYGNIKTVVAHLYGIAAEDIDIQCLEKNDPRYPMILGVIVHKE